MKQFINVLLLFLATNLTAQNNIEGVVFDSQTNESIAYANIFIPQLEKGTTTNDDGEFIIKNLPSGNYKILISYIGFETFSKTVNIPLKENLQIALIPSFIEMKEVIISTPFHKLQSENVMKVEQRKISDLKAKGAINLAEGITNIPGVAGVSTGISISKPVIRGLSSNRVLVYTQGIRLENQQFGDEHGLGINDAGIESVEVIKGPASLLYGSDALGGVLYINPERFALENENETNVNLQYFSNTEGLSTNVGYKTSGEHFKFLIRGSFAEHADYNTDSYRVTNTRFNEKDLKAALGYQSLQFKTELRYNLNASKLGIPEEIGVQNLNKSPLLPYQSIHNHIFSSKSKFYFEDSSLDVDLGFTYNDRKEFEEHHHHHEEHEEHEEHHEEEAHEEEEVLDPALQMKLKTFNYDIKYHLPVLGKFETIVGVQGMHQVNSNYGEEQLIPNATTNDFGVLATSHIHFEKADIQLGARFDTRSLKVVGGLEKDFTSFNGALGIKTNLANNLVARLNLATGFRAPNLAELTSYGSHEGTNRFEIGNENLLNEQNFQTDLAIEYKTDHLEIFANGFYNVINDYIYLSPNGEIINDNPVYLYLQEDATLYGGEVGIHIHPHPLDWLHFESSFETVTGKRSNNEFLPLIPANKFKNTLRAEFHLESVKKGFAFVSLNTTLKQNNISDFETNTSGYNLLSAGFGGELKLFKNSLHLQVTGNNLTNKKYINHLSRLKSDGIYDIGRNISVSVSYTL
ncbi:TonB-dependent receptor [Oceanihabitans sediminis]|uniref:TonB-dependent receptor n=1 Tax=Oceanihabitans sediminis TaxID=1812012 RepID=UPI00299DFB3A|nr:TonB-dependent receptor [Oceanihabitans sediminis]MDX1277160.1 TonB-dependent receptor [Oceanihabitans sediminis]